MGGRPGPEDGGEPDGTTVRLASDQLRTLAFRVINECRREAEQRLITGGDLVEVAVRPHQRKQIGEVLAPDDLDQIRFAHHCVAIVQEELPTASNRGSPVIFSPRCVSSRPARSRSCSLTSKGPPVCCRRLAANSPTF